MRLNRRCRLCIFSTTILIFILLALFHAKYYKSSYGNPTKLIFYFSTDYDSTGSFIQSAASHGSSCKVSKNIDDIRHADAVLLDVWAIGYKSRKTNDFTIASNILNEIRLYRRPQQLYIFMADEAPLTIYSQYYQAQPGIRAMLNNVLFNATQTYRRDSTFPGPYFKIIPRQLQKSSYENQFLSSVTLSKTKPLVWMSSSCGHEYVRSKVVVALDRHLDIDRVGSCMQNAPTPSECRRDQWHTEVAQKIGLKETCMTYIERTYYFMLALENSVCRDYVSEKLANVLRKGIVPIVLKRSIAEGIGVPPSAFIAFDDFDNVQQMAAHLKRVMKNTTQYMGYFDWKTSNSVTELWPNAAKSSICDELYQTPISRPGINISQWFFTYRGKEGGRECLEIAPEYNQTNTLEELWLILKTQISRST